MVKQTSGSACNFRTNSLDRLNNTCRPNSEWNQDHLRINSQSYDNNRFLLYSSVNNSLNIYHQNIRDLQGKTNELLISLYPELPHLLCLMEHHLYYLDLDHTYIEHYNLGAEYCRQALRQRGVCTFVHEKLKLSNVNLYEFCKEEDLEVCAVNFNFHLAISVFYPYTELHLVTFYIS
jgi:hypothetical protein